MIFHNYIDNLYNQTFHDTDAIITHTGYYGISMTSVKIGWNAYVSQISAAIMGIPSYLFCILLMDRAGRKPICCFGSILCGIACIAAGFTGGNFQLVSTLIGESQGRYNGKDVVTKKNNRKE